jgi:hypothetical protein
MADVIAVTLMAAAGPLLLWLIVDAAGRLRHQSRPSVWEAGSVWVLLVPLWCQLALTYGHVDDVLALLLAAAAANALTRRRFGWVAICVGAAAAAKPWGIAFVPLALAATDGRRLRHLAEAIAVAALPWLPFVLGDRHTLHAAGSFKIRVAASSVLAVFHVSGGTPSWVRPVQFLGGALLAFACVRSGRWTAAIALTIALRLAIDPNVYSYYSTGALVGAAIWDLLGSRVRLPVLTAIGFCLLYWPTFWSLSPHTLGILRLADVVVVPCFVVLSGRGGSDDGQSKIKTG